MGGTLLWLCCYLVTGLRFCRGDLSVPVPRALGGCVPSARGGEAEGFVLQNEWRNLRCSPIPQHPVPSGCHLSGTLFNLLTTQS